MLPLIRYKPLSEITSYLLQNKITDRTIRQSGNRAIRHEAGLLTD